MNKIIDLTGLSRAIANIKKWVQNWVEQWYSENRTHYKEGLKKKLGIIGNSHLEDTIGGPYVGTEKVRVEWEFMDDFTKEVSTGSTMFMMSDYRISNDVLSISFWYSDTDLQVGIYSKGDHLITGDITVYVDYKVVTLDEDYIPDTIARKKEVVMEWNDYEDGQYTADLSESPFDIVSRGEYEDYDWYIVRDGVKHKCVVIPDGSVDNPYVQVIYFTRNVIAGTTGPLGNGVIKYSGFRFGPTETGSATFDLYRISNGGTMESTEFVFGENAEHNLYLMGAAALSNIEAIDCRYVYTDTDGRITNVSGTYKVSGNAITYMEGTTVTVIGLDPSTGAIASTNRIDLSQM